MSTDGEVLGSDDGAVEVMRKGSALPVPLGYTHGEVLGSDDGIIIGSSVGEVLGYTMGAADGITLGLDEKKLSWVLQMASLMVLIKELSWVLQMVLYRVLMTAYLRDQHWASH